jgi:hypothetical protein
VLIPPAEKDKKEKFATHEKLKILAACGLHEGECWDQVPHIYDKITEDGRTRATVRDSMEQEYRATTMVTEFPLSVFLLMQLVSDMKDLKFSWQGSNAFESCYQGISPFSVPHSSIEAHQRLRALEGDTDQATTTTLADVKATRTRLPPCPPNYYGLLQMLCAYIKLLMMMFGRSCEHMANVMTIYFLVKDKMAIFERMDKSHVVSPPVSYLCRHSVIFQYHPRCYGESTHIIVELADRSDEGRDPASDSWDSSSVSARMGKRYQ